MDAITCLKKLQYIWVLNSAAVASKGNPFAIQQEPCPNCGSCYENCFINAARGRASE